MPVPLNVTFDRGANAAYLSLREIEPGGVAEMLLGHGLDPDAVEGSGHAFSMREAAAGRTGGVGHASCTRREGTGD